MLNRLFIVVGVLAILIISAAFVVPHFINWGDYRPRMEELASEAIGAPVRIAGQISLELLPRPRLRFADVRVGAPDAPILTVAGVEAELSLFDFLRDHYDITALALDQPRLDIGVGVDGKLTSPIAPPPGVSGSSVSIGRATITGGAVTLSDARSGAVTAEAISGELTITATGGPIGFQGYGLLGERVYDLRFTTTALEGDGKVRLSVFAQPQDLTASLSADGELATGVAPQFTGDLTLRSKPPLGTADLGRGDLVVASSVTIGLERVLLSAYTIVPDENRAGTRLTGAASLTLGANPKFNAVISGGVLALPPRDATAEDAAAPYELVRLLGELPMPPVLGVPGTVGVDIAELSLRALSLRNVRFDAVSGPDGWSVKDFRALLPGNGVVQVSGDVSGQGEHPHFNGRFALRTARLDALAALWRKPAVPNPLAGMGGELSANIALDDETLTLSEGRLTLAGEAAEVALAVGFSKARRVDVSADFGALDAQESAALEALLPDFSASGGFGVTFPRGSVALTAKAATIAGLDGHGLAAAGKWEGGVLELKELSAEDLGGAGFGLGLTIFGTLAHPELSGAGTLNVTSADAAALASVFDLTGVPPVLRDFVGRQLPADLALKLSPPGGDGGQTLSVAGRAGAGEVTGTFQLASGLFRAVGGPVVLALDAVSPDVEGLSAQLGIGVPGLLAPEGPMHASLRMEGAPSNSLETTVALESGADSLGFSGNLVVTNPARWSGSGLLKARLADPSALAEGFGVGGVAVPAFEGTAQLNFAGLDNVHLSAIDVQSGDAHAGGTLALVRAGETATVSGNISMGAVSLDALSGALLGPAALIGGEGIWPSGPIAVGDGPRTTSGKVQIEMASLDIGGEPLIEGVTAGLDWDARSLWLRELRGEMGGGTLVLDAGICCAGGTTEKTLSLRASVEAAPVDRLLPHGTSAGLSGTVTGAARVEGTGDSIAGIIATLSGEGSYTVRDARIDGLDEAGFAAVAGIEQVSDLDPDQLAALIRTALEQGSLAAPDLGGSFTVAGGTLRSPNLAVEAAQMHLFGGLNLRLTDLALEGGYTLTPRGRLGADGFINETTAQVVARLGGTLESPTRTFEVGGLVDAIQVHAYEVELVTLERLRAEDEARAKAAAEARARELAAQKAARIAADTAASVSEALATVAAAQQSVQSGVAAAGTLAAAAAQARADSIERTEAAAKEAARRAAAEQAARRAPPKPATQSAPLPALVLTPAEPATRF